MAPNSTGSAPDIFEEKAAQIMDSTKADDDMDNLCYEGENRPRMWWGEFERRLNLAFKAYTEHEDRKEPAENKKLSILLENVKCEKLRSTKDVIRTLSCHPATQLTYNKALAFFRSELGKTHREYKIDIEKADEDMVSLVYRGDQKLGWDDFEQRLNLMFERRAQERGGEDPDSYKIWILLQKVKCDDLDDARAAVCWEKSHAEGQYTYKDALRCFRSEAKGLSPPESAANKTNSLHLEPEETRERPLKKSKTEC